MVQTIIIARTDKIGDFVVSIPSYATARAMYPEAKIVALVSKFNRIIAENVACIDECVCIDDYQSMGELGAKLRSYHPDVFVALVSNNTISKLAVKSGAQRRIGPRSKLWSFLHYNDGLRQHRSLCMKSEAAYNLDLIRHIDPQLFDQTGIRFARIQYGQEDMAPVDAYLEQHMIAPSGFVLVNPFTGGSGANLALDQYGVVIDEIISGKNPYLGAQSDLAAPRGADLGYWDAQTREPLSTSSQERPSEESNSSKGSALRREFYEDQQAVEAVAPDDLSQTALAVTDPNGAKRASASSGAATAGTAGTAGTAESEPSDNSSMSAQLVREWAEEQSVERNRILKQEYDTQTTTDADGSVTVSWTRRDSASADGDTSHHESRWEQHRPDEVVQDKEPAAVESQPPHVVILGMKQHQEQMDEILESVSPQNRPYVHFFINEGSLLVAAALVDRCKVFIGPSTGITQIAGNYLKPAICFYSSRISNSHRRWELYGDPEEVAFTFNIKNLNPNNKALSRLQDGMKQAIVSTVLEEFYRR